MLAVTGVMHEADSAHLIWSTMLCYRPVRFLMTVYKMLPITTNFVAFSWFVGYVVLICALFLAGAESGDQFLLSS